MKYLVTGSTGLIGHQLSNELNKLNCKLYSCVHNISTSIGIPVNFDLSNENQIIATIEKIKPDVIIHLGAITDVEKCELNKDLALLINSRATDIIAKQSAKNNIFLLYLSTDYVFDGIDGLKKEDDLTNPICHYGHTKLEGENFIKKYDLDYCIARTSTPFGLHPIKKSFPQFVVENIKNKNPTKVVTDQFTSPTYVPNLCKMIMEIIERRISGTMHIAGATRISRFDLASLIVKRLSLNEQFLIPSKISEMNWYAKRPIDSSLNVSKANSILKETPLEIEQGIDFFINQLKN